MAPTSTQGIFTNVFSTPGRAQSLRITLQSLLVPVFTPDLTMRACMCLAHLMVVVGIVAGRVISSNRVGIKHGLPKSEDLSLLHLKTSGVGGGRWGGP